MMFAMRETKKQTMLAALSKEHTSGDRSHRARMSDNSSASAYFLQRCLGNSYLESLAGDQHTSGQASVRNGGPVIQGGTVQANRTMDRGISTLPDKSENPNPHGIDTAYQSRQPQREVATGSILLQRQETESSQEEQRQAGIEIVEDEEYPVQMRADGGHKNISLQSTSPITDLRTSNFDEKNLSDQIQKSKAGGKSIDSNILDSLESYFQDDFSFFFLHSNLQSDFLARKLNAQAFTVGENIFFRRDCYDPSSREGAYLLTHEVAHVRQQRRGISLQRSLPGAGIAVGKRGDIYEKEADQVANEFLRKRDNQAGEGPKIGDKRMLTVERKKILPPVGSNMTLQREGAAGTAAAVTAVAQATVGAVRTLTYGNYKLTRPDRLDATVTPQKTGCRLATLPVRSWRWRFYTFREIHPVFRYEFVNVHLVATWQTNGCDVRAFHVVSPAGHRRSRLSTDTKADIFTRVSARLVRAAAGAGSCCDHAAELLVPYEVTVDRPWPLSNRETDGRLYINGAGGSRRVSRTVWT